MACTVRISGFVFRNVFLLTGVDTSKPLKSSGPQVFICEKGALIIKMYVYTLGDCCSHRDGDKHMNAQKTKENETSVSYLSL